MGLADSLRAPERLLSRARVQAPEPKRLSLAVSRIPDRSGGSLRMEDVPALQARLKAMEPERPRLSARDLRRGCHVFLLPPDAPGRSPVGDWLLNNVESRKARANVGALIAAYLDRFDAEDPAILKLAAWLEHRVADWPWRAGDPWPRRAAAFALFKPSQAPDRLAGHVLASEIDAVRALAQAGLDGERLKGALVEAVFRAACVSIGRLKGAPAGPPQEKLLAWAGGADGRQRFPRSWPYLLDGCLIPWDRDEPAAVHKQRLVTELTAFAGGDPRTKPAPWRPVQGRPSMTVLMRWLTRASVMQFLDIVDESLRDHAARTMWAYRRAFWTSYLMGDPAKGETTIDGAWVAFQSTGAWLAEKAARGRTDFSGFGRHRLKSPDHSALIIQVGDHVIADWSHSGKYNVWKRSDRHAPRLYLDRYEGITANLDDAPLRESHVGAANYTWQKRLAGIIEGRTFFYEKPSWRPRAWT